MRRPRPGGWPLAARPAAVALPAGAVAHGVEIADAAEAVAELGALIDAPAAPGQVVQRRAEFLAGRWCAARALADLGATGAVGRAGNGAPLWPSGFVGSITHAHGRVLAVACRVGTVASIGIDLERVVGEATAGEVGPLVLDAGEQPALAQAVGARDTLAAFTLGFSAKESLYKCLAPFSGRFMDFDAARVLAAEEPAPGTGTITLELTRAWAPSLAAGRRIEVRYARYGEWVETLAVLPAPATGRGARA